MDLKRIFIIFCSIFAVNCMIKALSLKPINYFNSTFAASVALSQVIHKFYIENGIKFDIILNEEYSVHSSGIVENILSQNGGNFSYNLRANYKSTSDNKYLIKDFSIFFASKCSDLFFINNNYILLSEFSKNFKILIYIENCTLNKLRFSMRFFVKQLKLKMYRSLIEVFEFFLIDEGHVLHLATLEWFTKGRCNTPQLKLLNTFDKSSRNWKLELENYEKFQNFHGCKLVMLLPIEPYIWGRAEFDKNFKKAYGVGLTPVIFNILAKKLNFRSYFQPGTLQKDISFFDKESHIDNFLIPLNDVIHTPNVYFEAIQPVSLYSNYIHMTSPFLEIKDLICVTPGDLYTPYEKLLLPFDAITWTLFSVTFIIAFVSILIINKMPRYIQNAVYGKNIRTPSLNVLSIFFGIPQYRLPRRNLARFILIMFVFFCLIFRTCFQSKMFEFLSSKPRKASPNTIDDLIERNYTIKLVEYDELLKTMIEHEKDKW